MLQRTWSGSDRAKYHRVELQALLGGPYAGQDPEGNSGKLGQKSSDGWLRAVVRQVFTPLPQPGFQSSLYRDTMLSGSTRYTAFPVHRAQNLPTDRAKASAPLYACRSCELSNRELTCKTRKGFVNARAYTMLGRKDGCLHKERVLCKHSLLPLRPFSGERGHDKQAGLEIEYGLALLEHMLHVAHGFYDNTISLEGKIQLYR